MSNEGTIRLRNNSYKRVLDQGFQRRRQNKSVLGAATFDLSNESVYDESFARSRSKFREKVRRTSCEVAADHEYLWERRNETFVTDRWSSIVLISGTG